LQRFDLADGEQPVALAIDWEAEPAYGNLRAVADGIVGGLPKTIAAGLPLALVFANDHGDLIGQIIRHDLGIANDIVSIDCVVLSNFDYIDIGEVVQPANVVPVVVKSLVFPEVRGARAEVAAVKDAP
jgi:ethanolamine utilization protein EutA